MTLITKEAATGLYERPDIIVFRDIPENIICVSEGGDNESFDGEYDL